MALKKTQYLYNKKGCFASLMRQPFTILFYLIVIKINLYSFYLTSYKYGNDGCAPFLWTVIAAALFAKVITSSSLSSKL